VLLPCETASSRNLDRREDEALVGGRQVSPDRSHLPHTAGAEKLPAALRPVPPNYAEARAERVLGLPDDLALVQKGTHFRLAPMSEMAGLQQIGR
jgi:hypothetical protein